MTSSAGRVTLGVPQALQAKIAAFSLGLSVPLVVLGKSAMAPVAAITILFCLVQLRRADFRRRLRNVLFTPIGYAAAALLAVLLIGSMVSIHLTASLETWARTLAIVVFGPLIMVMLCQSPDRLGFVARGLVLATLLGQLYALYNLYLYDIALAVRGAIGLTDAFQPGKMFKMYASVMACLLPLVVWHGWQLGGAWRFAGVLALPLAVPILLGGGVEPSHSAIAGLAGGVVLAGLVALGLKLPRMARRGLVVGLILVAIAGAGYVFSTLPVPPVMADQVPPLPFPDWHRQVIWGFAFDVFLHNPVIGVGVNAVDMVAGAKSIIPGMNQEYIPSHPHNWVLEIAAETGLLGLLAMALCLLTILWTFIRHAANGRLASWPGLIFFGTFWVSALSNFSIWAAWWDISFVILLAISLATIQAQRPTPATGTL